MKSKHTYRVPRGGRPNYPPTPVFHEAVDPASMAAQLYSTIAGSKAKKATADAAAAGGGRGRRLGGGGEGGEAGPLVLQFPPSLKVLFRGFPRRGSHGNIGLMLKALKHLWRAPRR